MTTTIWKTIEYSLQATTFSEKQCSKLVSIVLSAALPKMGLCRTIDRKPIFSCLKFQGFNLKHPYFTQGVKKLQLILDPTDSICQILLTESIHMTGLECGLGQQFFQVHPNKYLCLTEHTWVTSLWKFLFDSNIKLCHAHPPIEKRFDKDDYLMSLFSKHFHKKDLQAINYCRIHLQVTMLSDIISLCGKKIKPNCWKGNPQADLLESSVIWPRQPSPSTSLWNLWRIALQRTLQVDSLGHFQTRFPINNF
jgi:hypothetical protein